MTQILTAFHPGGSVVYSTPPDTCYVLDRRWDGHHQSSYVPFNFPRARTPSGIPENRLVLPKTPFNQKHHLFAHYLASLAPLAKS